MKFKRLLLGIVFGCLLLTNIAFAEKITYKGVTKNVTTYESRTEAKDAGVSKVGSAKVDGVTYYFDADEFSDGEAIIDEDGAEDLKGMAGQAKTDISDIDAIFGNIKPDLGDSVGRLSGVMPLAQVLLGVLLVIAWVFYIFTVFVNGAAVIIPGWYDSSQNAAADSGATGGEKAKGFLTRFYSNYTKKLMSSGEEEEPGKKWIMHELRTLLIFIIITVGLTNGLFVGLIKFMSNLFFKFFGA